MVEIINKRCIKFDDRIICDEAFKRMNDAIISAVTDARGEFNRNKSKYREKVKRGMEVAKEVAKYKGIYTKDFIKYLREKLGGVGWRNLRRETVERRLEELGIPKSEREEIEKKPLMPQEIWEKIKEEHKKL